MAESSYTGFFIDWIEEWSQLFQRCNWYTTWCCQKLLSRLLALCK